MVLLADFTLRSINCKVLSFKFQVFGVFYKIVSIYKASGLTVLSMKSLLKISISSVFKGFILPVILFLSGSVCASNENIKLVVTAAFVSEKGLPVYDDLANYLGNKLSANVDVISGLTYDEADLMLEKGIIQIGFVCGLPYTNKVNAGKYELVAIPVMGNSDRNKLHSVDYRRTPGKYFSYTIVRKGSGLKSWSDLKGKTYVYNDINSNSGYNMPRYKLVQLGVKSWEDYFSSVTVSGTHEESIRMVASGLVDASSVDSLVLDYDRHLGVPDSFNVEIIEILFPGGAGIPPVVISSKASPVLKERLQKVLVSMHVDSVGKGILKRALLQSFELPDDSNYDDIRFMKAAARKAGFRDHVR